MGSTSKQKTTFAKLARERALRERRELKQAKKQARRQAAAASAVAPGETSPPERPATTT
jgi:tellurite resistance protein